MREKGVSSKGLNSRKLTHSILLNLISPKHSLRKTFYFQNLNQFFCNNVLRLKFEKLFEWVDEIRLGQIDWVDYKD